MESKSEKKGFNLFDDIDGKPPSPQRPFRPVFTSSEVKKSEVRKPSSLSSLDSIVLPKNMADGGAFAKASEKYLDKNFSTSEVRKPSSSLSSVDSIVFPKNMADGGAFAKASEKYLDKNFSTREDVPVKPIVVHRIPATYDDDDWQEPITVKPSTRGVRPRKINTGNAKITGKTAPTYVNIARKSVPFGAPPAAKISDSTVPAPLDNPDKTALNISGTTDPAPVNIAGKTAANLDSDDLGSILYGAPDKNFNFIVKGGMVSVHKIVLAARSPFFHQEFYENASGSTDSIILHDYCKEAVELVVKSCYNYKFDIRALKKEIGDQVINFSYVYNIRCAINMFQPVVFEQLNESNVCAFASLAVQSNAFELRQKCANLIADLICQGQKPPSGVEQLPAEFDKLIVGAISAKRDN